MRLESIHGAKKFKLKWFTMGVVFAGLLSTTVGFATRYAADEKEIKSMKKVQHMSGEVAKISRYILTKQPILWEGLAVSMAGSMVMAAETYKVPVDLVVGISFVESRFYPFAKSRTGALGVTQVDFAAWKEELGDKGNPYDPDYNINCGAYILSRNMAAHGVRKGLHIYNVGEGNYKRGVRNPKYVDDVYSAASEYRYFN